jgi:hypothetical protein
MLNCKQSTLITKKGQVLKSDCLKWLLCYGIQLYNKGQCLRAFVRYGIQLDNKRTMSTSVCDAIF